MASWMLPRYVTPVDESSSHNPEISIAWSGMVAKTYLPSWEIVRLWMFPGQ